MRKNLGLIAFALALPVVSACNTPREGSYEEQERMEPREQLEGEREREPFEQQTPDEVPMGEPGNTL